MKRSVWFYWIAGVSLAISILVAGVMSLRDMDREDVSGYPQMSATEIGDEMDALRGVSASPVSDPRVAFNTLSRFESLNQAIKRYNAGRGLTTEGHHKVVRAGGFDVVALDLVKNDYVNKVIELARQDWKAFEKAKSEALGQDHAPAVKYPPGDTRVPKAWAIVYFVGIVFAFGRFAIVIEEMGGSWWMSALTDWRFPFYLIVWFVGVFKYPTDIDVRMQVRRAYRFAVLVLSSALSLAAAGCAGKRVNTEPDERRVDTAKTWQMNASTQTWPSYIAGNGAVFHPAPVEQTTVNVTASNGVYVGGLHSTPITRTGLAPNFGREVDLSVGWNGKIGKTNVGTDLTMVDVTPLGRLRGNVIQTSASANRPLAHGFTPFVSVHVAMPARGESPKRGVFVRQGLRWGESFGRFSASAGAEVFHDTGTFGFDSGWLARGNASIVARLNKHWQVGVPIRWNKPLSAVSDGRRKELQGGLIVSWQP